MLSSEYSKSKNFKESWNQKDSEECEGWHTSVRKEFKDMINMGVQRKSKRKNMPPNRSLFNQKWIFKMKRDGQFSERLVVWGHTKIKVLDFTSN